MSEKVVSMKKRHENDHIVNPEEVKKIYDRFTQLSAYRGTVLTKNNIRNLPDIKAGEIFWVSSESKGYIVYAVDGKKVTLKPLDEMATISTGITIYEMNKSIIEKEPLFDMSEEDHVNDLKDDIVTWFTDTQPAVYYLAYGKELNYVTLFKKSSRYEFNHKSAKEIIDTITAVGSLISMEFEDDRIEIWIRTKGSRAELIYLMPYDKGLVKLN